MENWSADAACPQCGAAVSLEIGDPVLPCSYCRTRLYLAPGKALRYRLLSDGRHENRLFLPFWRTRGLRFRVFADPPRVEGSLLDATVGAWPGAPVRANLGIRPQAARMALVGAWEERPGTLGASAAGDTALARLAALDEGHPVLERLIGESQSVVETPAIAVEQDGAASRLREAVPDGESYDADPALVPDLETWNGTGAGPVPFVPLLCPECGHDLPASAGSVAFVCRHCGRAWQMTPQGMAPLPVFACGRPSAGARLFPFWRFSFEARGLPFTSRAELRKWVVPYQPVPAGWEEQPPQLLVPGFKVQPRVFLRASKLISFAKVGESELLAGRSPATAEPVRLPLTEAAQALELILAHCVETYPKAFPLLSEAKLAVASADLLLVPFRSRGPEWVQEGSGIALQVTSVGRGARL